MNDIVNAAAVRRKADLAVAGRKSDLKIWSIADRTTCAQTELAGAQRQLVQRTRIQLLKLHLTEMARFFPTTVKDKINDGREMQLMLPCGPLGSEL